MNAKPIILNVEAVRALLAGRKSQARIVANVTNARCVEGFVTPQACFTPRPVNVHLESYCPYAVGTLLWVREAHGFVTARGDLQPDVIYRADGPHEGVLRWKSPICMPRLFSRLTLRVTNVRLERVQDISVDDCHAEGVTCWIYGRPVDGTEAITSYIGVWGATNGKKPGASWKANPWVWALTFDVIEKNVNEVET